MKMKLLMGASLIALVASSLVYIHIDTLTSKNKLLEAQNHSQSIVIDSYAANAVELSNLKELQDKTLISNRVARDKLVKEKEIVINKLKEVLNDTKDECVDTTLPESVLNSLLNPETTN